LLRGYRRIGTDPECRTSRGNREIATASVSPLLAGGARVRGHQIFEVRYTFCKGKLLASGYVCCNRGRGISLGGSWLRGEEHWQLAAPPTYRCPPAVRLVAQAHAIKGTVSGIWPRSKATRSGRYAGEISISRRTRLARRRTGLAGRPRYCPCRTVRGSWVPDWDYGEVRQVTW